ncbi:MAG: EAL domain-containing protein [Chloroflexi bacterium]|nr:MAG: EAL domain-containing protein [Chloroflexota bacterium]MBL1194482.1 EAL domain-containing protein [Chloroflexota bacterium]NOH11770.1 EAL domain-containing protein [Chloroflexota bacterium]
MHPILQKLLKRFQLDPAEPPDDTSWEAFLDDVNASLVQADEQREQIKEQLSYDALHDALTGLPNRTLLLDRLQQAIERRKRNPEYDFAVIFMDLDRFKIVNDSLGHKVGDLLLIEITHRLTNSVRSMDTVARMGGDEFVILLEDVDDVQQAQHFAARILEGITAPLHLEDHEIITTGSLGIVVSEARYENPEDYLRDADIAMYHAKEMGKSRYEVFTAELHRQAMTRLTMEASMRKGVEQKEFVVYYQPIISLKDEQIVGFEALLRWQHPRRGFLLPADFLPLAEETGLIVPIGKWVLDEVCRQTAEWNQGLRSDAPLSVNVNLSTKQLIHPNLVDDIQSALAESGLESKYLTVEMMEGALVRDEDLMREVLQKLKDLGISVHMDNFGTGFSWLGNINEYSIDAIKINRGFIASMDIQGNNAGLVRTITNMAQELGVEVYAEGIETSDQKFMLTALGADCGQGYLFGKPQDAEASEGLLN